MKIYIGRNGEQQGPYSIEELNNLAKLEPITGNDMCWYNGCAAWIPLSQLAGFIPSPSPPPTAVPSAFQQKQPSTASLPTAESGMGTNANETLYYLVLDSEQAGPFTSGQLRAMWQNGKVNAQTKYCAVGGTSWRPLIDLRTMLEPVPGQPTPVLPPPRKASSSPPDFMSGLRTGLQRLLRQTSPSPSGFMSDLRIHPLGGIMLAFALLGAIFSWNAEPNTVLIIVWGVVIVTAILGGIEAEKLGIGSDGDKNAKGKRKMGPWQWGASIFFLWYIGFPAYLYQRSRYGARNLLLPAVVVSLLSLAALFLASPTLPAVDAPEVLATAQQAIEESPAGKLTGALVGPIKITDAGEVSYDSGKQKRVARAVLKTKLGSEVIYYTVEWQNRSKGIIWVQIQAHP
jgi:hypothetical protein